MCDRVGIIEKGELLAVGTVEEIQPTAWARIAKCGFAAGRCRGHRWPGSEITTI